MNRPIISRLGGNFLHHVFSGISFIRCIIEIIKNSRDAGATYINIDSRKRSQLVVFDNGCGMGADNRDRFMSVAVDLSQEAMSAISALFCMGAKWLPFSECSRVDVITAPTEDAGKVFKFGYSISEFTRKVRDELETIPEMSDINGATWPYPHPTGTQIAYTYADQSRRTIQRGERLALNLAARLPLKLHSIVHVDGKPLPERELIGEVFNLPEDVLPEHLDPDFCSLELLRPKDRTQEDGLRFTAREIGEVGINDFFRSIGDLRNRLPGFYSDVCGVISAPFLHEHVKEDRKSFKTSLMEDERIFDLVVLLETIAPQVKEALQIEESQRNKTRQDRVNELLREFEVPGGNDNGPPPPPPRGPGQASQPRPIVLSAKPEYEIGDSIEITARLRDDLMASGVTINQLVWELGRSRGDNPKSNSTGLRLRASEIGRAKVSVDLPGSLHSASASYEVVNQRRLKLSCGANLEVNEDRPYRIQALNADKLSGEPVWAHVGVGELEYDGATAIFRPTTGGLAEITVMDSADEDVCAVAQVIVKGGGHAGKLIQIREHYFRKQDGEFGERMQPVVMIPGDDEVHHLYVNADAPGSVEAEVAGGFGTYLKCALAFEYARFRLTELEPPDGLVDGIALARRITAFGYEVSAELLRKH